MSDLFVRDISLAPPRREAFFFPLVGCSRRCVYCDQQKITGEVGLPDLDAVHHRARSAVEPIELCFFGGSFGSLDDETMISYLDAIRSAPRGSRITFSTYPRDFDGDRGAKLLSLLSNYPIGTIELGTPSFDRRVLAAVRRDDDPAAVLRAIERVASAGFHVGAQLMTGLPHQDEASSLADIDALSSIMPDGARWHLRIYPCLTLKGTPLDEMRRAGEYEPQTIDGAARVAAAMIVRAEDRGFEVIRVGLHDSPSLREAIAAGPWSPSFGEIARGEAMAIRLVRDRPRGPWIVGKKNISLLTGHGGRAISRLAEMSGLSIDEVRGRITFV